MASVDERIVRMKFDKGQFEKGVQSTLSTLDRLKKALKFDNVDKSFKGIEIAASNVDFSKIDEGIVQTSTHLSKLGVIGTTVLANLTNSAVNFGKGIVRNVLGPLTTGGFARASNIEQARFKLEGLGITGDKLAAVWQNVQDAVNDTAYSLDQAALIAAQLSASGIQGGKDMGTALRAVSGVAAVTGSSYQDIGIIFSQIAGQGRLMGQDLLQLSARGFNAASTLGKAFGKTEAEVRDMVSKGQVDFQTFANAMEEAFGDAAFKANNSLNGVVANVRSALSKIGEMFFSPFITNTTTEGHVSNLVEMFNAIRNSINSFKNSLAPVVSTFTDPLLKIVQGVTSFIETFDRATKSTKELADEIKKGKWGESADQIKKLTEAGYDFEKAQKAINIATGKFTEDTRTWRDSLIEGFANLTNAIVKPVNAVLGAFGDVFKIEGLVGIVNYLTDAFARLTKKLIPSEDALKAIYNVSKLVFNGLKLVGGIVSGAFDIAIRSITGFIGVINNAISAVSTFINGVREKLVENKEFIKAVGLWKEAVDNFREAFHTLVDGVAEAIEGVLDTLGMQTDGIKKFREAFESGTANIIAHWALIIATSIKDLSVNINDFIKNIIPGFVDGIKGMATNISDFLSGIFGGKGKAAIVNNELISFANALNYLKEKALEFINAVTPGKIIAIFTAFIFIKNIIGLIKGIMKLSKTIKNIADNIPETIDKIGDAFEKIGKISGGIKLAAIAGSLALLALAIKEIASLNPAEIATGLIGVALSFGLLIGMLKLLEKINIGEGAFKIAALLLVLGKVVNDLVDPIKELGSMKIDQLIVGILGITVAIGALAIAVNNMPRDGIKGSASLLLLATAIKMLVNPIKELGSMSLGQLATAVGAIASSLLLLILAVNNMPRDSVKGAISLLALAQSLRMISDPIITLSNIPLAKLATGMGAIAASLLILILALNNMPRDSVKGAASLLALSAAINMLVAPITKLSSLPLGQLAYGIGSIAAMLLVLIIAVNNMPRDSIKGAMSILALSVAIKALTDPIIALSNIPFEKIVIGLVGIATGLTALVIAVNNMPRDSVKGAMSILMMALALKILENIVTNLATFSWESLGKGAAAIAFGLTALVIAVNNMPRDSVKGAMSILAIASALKILESVVTNLASLSWESLGKGAVAIAGGLTMMIIALRLLPKNPSKGATSLLIMAVALKVLAGPIEKLSRLSWSQIGKGLLTVAGGLVVLVAGLAAVSLIKGSLVAAASSILMVASAITLLTIPLSILASMSEGQLIKGGLSIAAMLVGLVAALYAMSAISGTVAISAASLVLLAAGLTAVGLAMLVLGQADPNTLATGLLVLGAALAGLLIAGTIAMFISPGLYALSAALLALGAAAVLIGAGLYLGAAAFNTFVNAFVTASQILPGVGQQLAQELVNFSNTIRENAFQIGYNIVAGLIEGIVGGIAGVVGGLISVCKSGLDAVLGFFGIASPSRLMMEIGKYIPEGLAEGITGGSGEVSDAMGQMSEFGLDGLNIDALISGANEAGTQVGSAYSEGTVAGLTSTDYSGVLQAYGINLGGNTSSGVAQGISQNQGQVQEAGAEMMRNTRIVLDGETANYGEVGNRMASRVKGGAEEQSDSFYGLGSLWGQKAADGTANADYSTGATQAADQFTTTFSNSAGQGFSQVGRNAGVQILQGLMSGMNDIGNVAMQIAHQLKGAFANLATDGAQIGRQFGLQISAGLANTSTTVTYMAKTLVNTALTNIKSMTDQFTQNGKAFGLAIAQGLASTSTTVSYMARTLVNTASAAISGSTGGFISAGVACGMGFAIGISSTSGIVYAAAYAIGLTAARAAKAAVDSHSPSKVFASIGKFCDQGFAIGLNQYSNLVYDSSYSAAEQAVGGFYAGLGDDFSNIQVDPTIRPVVDLSNVDNAANYIGSIFGSSSLTPSENISLSRNIGSINARIPEGVEPPSPFSDTHIVERINMLGQQMENLNTNIKNMSVTIDGRELVGAIDTRMDDRLTYMNKLRKRGV